MQFKIIRWTLLTRIVGNPLILMQFHISRPVRNYSAVGVFANKDHANVEVERKMTK